MSQINTDDYDLSKPISSTSGLRQGLTSYGDAHFSLFLRKVFIKALGYTEDALSRPIIGIINTYSALNPCHANVPQLIEAVKRGVQLNGGLAVEFPTISIHEAFSSPTSMFLRNLMSMDTEEMIKAQPLDACIMIGGEHILRYQGHQLNTDILTGCDKTVPAQIMGGISANKPVLPLVTGPMMPGSHRGTRLGACTDCRGNWAAYRAGSIDVEDIGGLNEELAPTVCFLLSCQNKINV
jgi:dihydroxy-acid dehydratase